MAETRIAFILLGINEDRALEILATSRVLDRDLLDRAANLFRCRIASEFHILRVLDNTNGMLGSALLPVEITVTATVSEEARGDL